MGMAELGASVHMGSGFPQLEPCAGRKSVTWVWSEDWAFCFL